MTERPIFTDEDFQQYIENLKNYMEGGPGKDSPNYEMYCMHITGNCLGWVPTHLELGIMSYRDAISILEIFENNTGLRAPENIRNSILKKE